MAVGVVKRAGVVWSVVHTGSKVVGKHRISERLNDSGDRLSTSVVNKRGSVVVVGTAVVDTAALAGDEEIVVVVWVTVVRRGVNRRRLGDDTGRNGGLVARGGHPGEHSGGEKTCPKRIT